LVTFITTDLVLGDPAPIGLAPTPVGVSWKHLPHPEPHHVPDPKIGGLAAAVNFVYCQAKGLVSPVPHPQAPICPSQYLVVDAQGNPLNVFG